MRLLILLLVMITSCLNAQANWQPGYIIKDGQKIEGEIDDREWPYYIEDFRFRASPEAEVVIYSSVDEVSFGVSGRNYINDEVNYITNSRELAKITKDTTINRTRAQVFLRQYYDGELGLYQFIDQKSKRHFYLKRAGQELEYLEYELRLRRETGAKKVKYLENYKYQLTQILKDCPTLSGQAAASPYTLKALTKLVKSYYKCQEVSPTYSVKVGQGTFSFGGLLSYLSTTPIGQESESGEISTEAAAGPAFGVGARYVFPGAREKFAVRLEGLYHSFDDATRIQTRENGSSATVIRRSFSASVIQLHLLAEVQLLTGKTSVYAEAGVAASFLLDSDQSQVQITIAPDGSETRFTEDLNVDVNMTDELGWLAGVGVRRGSFQLGVRASRVARVKGNSGIGFIRAGLLAGYWF